MRTALVITLVVLVGAYVVETQNDSAAEQTFDSQLDALKAALKELPDFSTLPKCETMFRCRHTGKCVNSANDCVLPGAPTTCTTRDCIPPTVDISCGRLAKAIVREQRNLSIIADPNNVNSPVGDASGNKPLGAVTWDAHSEDFTDETAIIRMSASTFRDDFPEAESDNVRSYVIDLALIDENNGEDVDVRKTQKLSTPIDVKFWVYHEDFPDGNETDLSDIKINFIDPRTGEWRIAGDTRITVERNNSWQLTATVDHFTSFAVLLGDSGGGGGGGGGGSSGGGGKDISDFTTMDWVIYSLTVFFVLIVCCCVVSLCCLHIVSPTFRDNVRGTVSKQKKLRGEKSRMRSDTMSNPTSYNMGNESTTEDYGQDFNFTDSEGADEDLNGAHV